MNNQPTDLLDRPIAFYRCLAELCDSVPAGLMLSQALYWQKRTTSKDGWFYKTAEEWKEETYLSPYEQRTAREKCKKYLLSDLRGIPAQLYYKVDLNALNKDLLVSPLKTSSEDSSQLDSEEIANINKNSETTTETTTVLKKKTKKSKTQKTKVERPRDLHYDVIAELCAPKDETKKEYWMKFNAGWIAKCANSCRPYPPEKIREWFGESGWWSMVHCKGLPAIPPVSPTNIGKNVSLAAAWDGFTDIPSEPSQPLKTGDSF